MYFTLQSNTPYESCLLWDMHQNYYQDQGIQAFLQQEVPYNVSSNPCYAADCVRLFLASEFDSEANQILEIGAGLGIFALNFLQAVKEQAPEQLSHLTYWLSDYSRQGLQDLSQHPAFAPWIASGHLKLCRFDVQSPDALCDPWGKALTLPRSGFQMVIANYVFSTLPTAVLLRRGEQWQRQITRLESWPLGSDPSPETRKLYCLGIAQALQGDRLLDQIPADHPNYAVFKALHRAQVQTAQLLIESDFETNTDIKAWLEQQLARSWAEALGQNPDDAAQQSVLIQSIRSIVSDPLFQFGPDQKVQQDSLKEIHDFETVSLNDVCINTAHIEAIESLTQSSLVASVGYSASAIQTIQHCLQLLKPKGFLLISDKAYADASWMLSDQAEKASHHGQSLAHPVNFPLLEAIALQQGCSVMRTHNPTQALHHLLIYPQPALPEALQEAFEQRFLHFPSNEISHALLEGGHALMQNEALEQAARCFERALNYRPTDGTLQYFYAVCLLNQGHYQRALPVLEHAHDDYFGILNRDILLAEVYRFFEKYPLAIDYYIQSFRHGENSQSLYNMALCQIELEQLSDALTALKRAAQLDPNDPDVTELMENLLDQG